MNVEAKKELYDALFRIGEQTMNYYNPCEWSKEQCIRMRSSKGDDKGCCEGCRHLSRSGCTVKSLGCKLWLCEHGSDGFRECEAELKLLRLVAEYCGVPFEFRKSKEENFQPHSAG